MEWSIDALPGRLFSRMHAGRQFAVETEGLFFPFPCTVSAGPKQMAERLRDQVVQGCRQVPLVQPERSHHGDVPAEQDAQALFELDRLVSAIDPTFGKNHQLLSAFEQIQGKTKGG